MNLKDKTNPDGCKPSLTPTRDSWNRQRLGSAHIHILLGG